jgi:hypothetical protein
MSSVTSADPHLAYTYSSLPNHLDDPKMHYLAIPVDSLNTRSVTIQVFYDNSDKPKEISTDKETEKKPLKLLVDFGSRKQVV